VLEGEGVVGEYVGGYSDWVRQRKAQVVEPSRQPERTPPSRPNNAEKKRRLTFNEKSELAGLPDRIDALERERESVYVSLGDPAMLRDGEAVVAAKARLGALDVAIAELTQRWEVLESIAAEG
jgi:ATP-binding cassette subfamily F protein uup